MRGLHEGYPFHSHQIAYHSTLAVASIPVWISIPGPYTLAEWAEAERHLGPRLARRAWRGARARGHQGFKRPTAQDPDRAFNLSFYLSAGCAAPGPSEHATSSHPYPTCPEPPGGKGISLSSTPAPHTRPLVRPRTLAQDPGPTLGPGTSRCWYHSPIHHIDVPGGEEEP